MTASNGNRSRGIAWGVALTISAFAAGAFAVAQEAPAPEASESATAGESAEIASDPNLVYATIDGVPITEADLDVAAQDYLEELSRMPEEMRVSQLLNVVIDMRLLARAAEEAGIDKKDLVIRRIAFDRSRALRNEYLRDKAMQIVTDEAVRTRFEEESEAFVPGDELHLRHILVATEDEGKTIIADIDKGGDFAAIAREKSLDPGSGANGGDLGFVPKGRTVPEFEQAAFTLEVGAHTKEPVQSQFGWHVIKLEEKRKEPSPAFEAEDDRIRNDLIREFVTGEVESLRAAAEIEIIPPPRAPVEGGETGPAGEGAGSPAQ